MSKQLAAQAPVEPIVLGKMGSSYGIRGWLRVFSSTEDAESIFDYQPWFIQKAGQWQQVQLESWKHHNQDLIIKLKGVDDRDSANCRGFLAVASAGRWFLLLERPYGLPGSDH